MYVHLVYFNKVFTTYVKVHFAYSIFDKLCFVKMIATHMIENGLYAHVSKVLKSHVNTCQRRAKNIEAKY